VTMESRPLTRVVWEEGMHLAQHHFQAQGRFFEHATSFALSSLYFAGYGFAGLELDRESLLNGTVSLRQARGILPDGLVFHFPHDPPPAPLNIRDLFSPTRPAHVVHLAIPPYRAGAANTAQGEEPDAGLRRFVAETREQVDEISGEETRPITFGRKNFRLVLDEALDEGGPLVTLPMARIIRDGRGNFVYDSEFIPPVLRIGAVPALGELLDRVLEMVDARARSLRPRGAPPEVAQMWLAHALHQSLPALRHLRETRGAHPEALYQELARLAGALCTFTLEARAQELPLYRHDELGRCFGDLERHLRSNLDVVLPTGSYRLDLDGTGHPFYVAQVPDREVFHGARFFLGIRGDLPVGELTGRIQRVVKVCSAEHIQRLVREAFPGLDLTHVTAPPSALRPTPGTQYFELHKEGPCWTLMEKSGSFGIYLPDSIPDAQMELVVLP